MAERRVANRMRDALEMQRKKKELEAQRATEAEAQRAAQEKLTMQQEEAARGPGYIAQATNEFERRAGVRPPGFEGFRDKTTRELLQEFKFDPYQSQMTAALRSEALSNEPSRWAQSAMERADFEQSQALGRMGLEQQKAQSAAQSQLMRQGGLGGGARASLARQGMRDAMMAGQGVYAQGAQRRFGIQDADLLRKQELTGTLADIERQSQLQNIGMLEKDVARRSDFDRTRYLEQMKAWAAKEQADAQRAAASNSGGCFPEWTKLKLKDGQWKKIFEIEIGDELFVGGKVTDVYCFSKNDGAFNLYDYCGVDVTGDHAVLENSEWVRVKDSKRGIKTTMSVKTVYNISTENHQLFVGNTLFSDYMETNDDIDNLEESLRSLNGAII